MGPAHDLADRGGLASSLALRDGLAPVVMHAPLSTQCPLSAYPQDFVGETDPNLKFLGLQALQARRCALSGQQQPACSLRLARGRNWMT